MDPKQRAAEAALQFVVNDSVIGLGSGSTADRFMVALAEALRAGRVRNVRGVATSEQTARRAAELGISLLSLAQATPLAVTIDGADEISPALNLIKGMGGALLREKIIAQNSKSLIVIADASKLVEKLGMKSPLPVEVVRFEHEVTARFLMGLGCEATLRRKGNEAYVTDNGNYIYDCRFAGGIDDAVALNEALAARAGVVESGLFLGMAQMAIVADELSVQTLTR